LNLVQILVYTLEVLLLFYSAYLFFPFFLFPLFYQKIKRLITADYKSQSGRINHFYFVIAAYNEVDNIAYLLQSIASQNYPNNKVEVLVVADHCTDKTSEIVKSFNYTVVEKNDNIRNGKSEVIAFAAEFLNNKAEIDNKIIVVVDADCVLEPGFCAGLDWIICNNQDVSVFQAFREVKNIKSSAVSSLDASAESIRQWINQGVRHCLGLNVKMHGSGMAFKPNVFFESLHSSKGSLAEDQIWNAALLINKKQIGFAYSAHLSYVSTSTTNKFSEQRKRWIRGQFEVARKIGVKLLFKGLSNFNINQIDFALSLFLPPRSFLLITLILFIILDLMTGLSLITSPQFLALIVFSYFVMGFIGILLSGAHFSFTELLTSGFKLVWNVFITTFFAIFGKKSKKWGNNR